MSTQVLIRPHVNNIFLIYYIKTETEYLRSVAATVSVKFTFSSGIKAIAAAHAAAPASAASPASAAASHRPITNRPEEEDKEHHQCESLRKRHLQAVINKLFIINKL